MFLSLVDTHCSSLRACPITKVTMESFPLVLRCNMDPQIAICCGFVFAVGTVYPLAIVHHTLVPSKALLKRIRGIALIAVVQLSFVFSGLVFLHSVFYPVAEVALVTVEFVTAMFFPLVDFQFAKEGCHKVTTGNVTLAFTSGALMLCKNVFLQPSLSPQHLSTLVTWPLGLMKPASVRLQALKTFSPELTVGAGESLQARNFLVQKLPAVLDRRLR